MQTSAEVEATFVAELRELMGRYRATCEAEEYQYSLVNDDWDTRIVVHIPEIKDEHGHITREPTFISLGKYFP